MFRNQYDTDVTTWSPQGRLFQVEYAMEAVKQGSACVGLRSATHAVLAAANKSANELSSHQRKVFRVADHAGVALAGLTADGRVLSRFLRNECINHAFVYDAPLPVSRLALRLADKAQVCTQRSWKRPYGVGLLVAGSQDLPRTQIQKFNAYTPDELFKDALSAIKETLQGEKLTSSNCTIAIVGRREDGTVEPFSMIDSKRIQEIIDSMEAADEAPAADAPAESSSMQEDRGDAPPAADAPAADEPAAPDAPAPMDI
ncbi:hypothetical protein ZWY2020_016387 [Hordeum vulgare]|nr:hypothetical protein ZWY2020_016387 [Hordeum vulgare]